MEKKCNYMTVFIWILVIGFGLALVSAIAYLCSEYHYLAIEVEHLKSRIGNRVIQMPNEIEFYSNITDSAISRINSAVTILGVIATIFGLLGIVFTVITGLKNKEMEDKVHEKINQMEEKSTGFIKEVEERVKQSVNEANKKIDNHESQINQINIIQHILYADKHRNSKKLNYAIKEYVKALKIDEYDHLILYELGVLYADEYTTNPSDLIFATACDYLFNAVLSRKSDHELISDSYMTIGALYGQRGKRDKNKSDLKSSIDYFLKSIECNGNNIDAYTNMALSHIYDGNKENARKCFERAIAIDKSNFLENKGISRFRDTEELLAILGEETPKEIVDKLEKIEGDLKEIEEGSNTEEYKKLIAKKEESLEKKKLLEVKENFKLILRDLF